MLSSYNTEIRQVQASDYEDLARFFQENNRHEITRYFDPFPLITTTAYKIACTDYNDRYYVAVSDGRIVGLCMFRGWDEGFEIPSFGLIVDYRQKGGFLGTQLIEFGEAEAQRLRCKQLRVSVYSNYTAMMRLCKTLGYKEISRKSVVKASKQVEKIVMIKDFT